MLRVVGVGVLLAVGLVFTGCGDEPGPAGPAGPTPVGPVMPVIPAEPTPECRPEWCSLELDTLRSVGVCYQQIAGGVEIETTALRFCDALVDPDPPSVDVRVRGTTFEVEVEPSDASLGAWEIDSSDSGPLPVCASRSESRCFRVTARGRRASVSVSSSMREDGPVITASIEACFPGTYVCTRGTASFVAQ